MSQTLATAQMAQDKNFEVAYLMGSRSAHTMMLSAILTGLGYDSNEDPLITVGRLVSEREATVAILRKACLEFGDNDWSDQLHLRDVIDKHLLPYLHEQASG